MPRVPGHRHRWEDVEFPRRKLLEIAQRAAVAADHIRFTDAEALAAVLDDATSDPLIDGSAADGVEESAARKDHVHPFHHAEAHTLDSHATRDHGDLNSIGTTDHADQVSQAEAEAGTATTDRMWTAERVSQAIAALGGGGGGGGSTLFPVGLNTGGSNNYVLPFYNGTDGDPPRAVNIAFSGTNSVKVISYSKTATSGIWHHKSSVDGLDESVTLGVAASNIARMHGFAIESPASATNPVVFIETHNAATNPDVFSIFSIEITDGSSSMTAVAVTIAGANAPPDTNLGGTMSIPIATNKIMTFFEDDIYFGDITGDETGFTITYTDAKVTAWTTINIASTDVRKYSGYSIGSRAVILRHGGPSLAGMWEVTSAGVLTEAWTPFTIAGLSNDMTDANVSHTSVFAEGGNFKMLTPDGGGATNQNAHYEMTDLPIDEF